MIPYTRWRFIGAAYRINTTARKQGVLERYNMRATYHCLMPSAARATRSSSRDRFGRGTGESGPQTEGELKMGLEGHERVRNQNEFENHAYEMGIVSHEH